MNLSNKGITKLDTTLLPTKSGPDSSLRTTYLTNTVHLQLIILALIAVYSCYRDKHEFKSSVKYVLVD